jgi:hypothetical protein
MPIVGEKYFTEDEYELVFGDKHGLLPEKQSEAVKEPGTIIILDDIEEKETTITALCDECRITQKYGTPRHSGVYERDHKATPEDEEKAAAEDHINKGIKAIFDKHFPGRPIQLTTEYKVGKEGEWNEGTIQISTVMKAPWLKGSNGMMSTIDSASKTITHDDYFFDHEIKKGDKITETIKHKGLSSFFLKNAEKIAAEKGCTKAVLLASNEGRIAWPKLGFKCSDRKQFLDIQAFGKSKGLEIKNELDFEKLEPYFVIKGKGIMAEDIEMKKPVGVYLKKKGLEGEMTEREFNTMIKEAREEIMNKITLPEKMLAYETKKNETTAIDKTNQNICPLCGWKLIDGVCVNQDCEVIDNASEYR